MKRAALLAKLLKKSTLRNGNKVLTQITTSHGGDTSCYFKIYFKYMSLIHVFNKEKHNVNLKMTMINRFTKRILLFFSLNIFFFALNSRNINSNSYQWYIFTDLKCLSTIKSFICGKMKKYFCFLTFNKWFLFKFLFITIIILFVL